MAAVLHLHHARIEALRVDDDSGLVRLLLEIRDDPTWDVIDEVDSLAIMRRA